MTRNARRGFWVALLLFFALLRSHGAVAPRHPVEFPDFDRRAGQLEKNAPNAAAKAAQAAGEARLRARLPEVVLERHEIVGSPQWLHARDGLLTGPQGRGRALAGAEAQLNALAQDEHGIIRAFVNEHAAVFGHNAAALEGARVSRDFTAAHNGVRTTVWEQMIDDIPVYRARFVGHLTRDGELISVASGFLADVDNASTPAQRQWARDAAPPVSAARAIVRAGQSIEVQRDESKIEPVAPAAGAERKQTFRVAGMQHVARTALTWMPMNAQSVRLCWMVMLAERGHGYEIFVDAETGDVLKRHCVTEHAASPASFRVFTLDGPTPKFPGYSTPTTNQPAVVSRTLLTLTSLNSTASPDGWVATNNLTSGNNVHAFYWKPLGDNSYVGTYVTSSPPRTFDFPLNLGSDPSSYVKASLVNAFYWVNFMHDKLYELGFTETAGNCQKNNFGRGGVGNDEIELVVQDKDEENNAGLTAWGEGASPELNTGIFTGPNPDRDSAFDTTIVLHEYTHALSNRLVGDGAGLDKLQSRGMGEGWSDFYALSFLAESGDDVDDLYPKAAYCSFKMWGFDYQQNYYFGIRRYPYTTDMSKNPLTFKDIDPAKADDHAGIPTNPTLLFSNPSEVHNQGEVWCVTLWDARANLIKKHGFATGSQLMLQLVTDGMKLAPPNPTFVQARDAILMADQVNNASANQKELWAAFAKRGLGYNAVAPANTTTSGVIEDFNGSDVLKIGPFNNIVVQGPVGGPFDFVSTSYSLTNAGASSLSWNASIGTPFTVSPSSGTLAAGAHVTVTVSLNADAAALYPAGVFQRAVVFVNQGTGVEQQRSFVLRIGQPDTFTEFFLGSAYNDNADLEGRCLTFTPDGSVSFYSVCRDSASGYPVDPTGGNVIDFSALTNDAVLVTLSNSAKVSLYGFQTNKFYLAEHGDITFAPDPLIGYYPGLASHFAQLRVSPFNQPNQDVGTISWKQLADRVAITWDNVKDLQTPATNSFQLEMFFNGIIRMTWVRLDSPRGIVGISKGTSLPLYFLETDLSAIQSCAANPLTVVVPPFTTEGAGVLTNAGTVRMAKAPPFDVTVSITSSKTNKVIPPASTVILAGHTNAIFSLTVVDNALLDGSQPLTIKASAPGYSDGIASMLIHDNESATLTVTLPAAIAEGGGITQGIVTASAPVAGQVFVTLVPTRPEELELVAPGALIPQGQISGTFFVKAVDDTRLDGTQVAGITAIVSNWVSGTTNMNVLDNESTNLTLSLPFFASEGAGTITNGGTVSISGTLTTNLLIGIFSDDTSEVQTPLFGAFLAAGETNALFSLFMQDDAIIDGLQLVRLRAVAGGFGPATNYMFVADNDGPPDVLNPYPPDQSTDIPVNADLSWSPVEGQLVVNGDFESGNLNGWTTEDSGAGAFVINNGTFDPASPDGPLPALSGTFSALSQQLGNGKHAIWQDIYIPDGATGVTLSWTDRVRNHALQFAANQQFRVELRDPDNNKVLITLFSTSTSTNTPLFGSTTNRSVNLNAWRGRFVRLAFVDEDALGYLNVHLDNVSIIATAAAATFFDVYLGTNNPPNAGDFLGSTTNSSWTLSLLAGGTDYYWQINTRRSGITNTGPVWHFTTEGDSTNTALIAFHSSWKYRNNGQNLGTTWTNLTYNDTSWSSGLGILGFGGNQDTTISHATNYITYYFRAKFTLSDTSRVVALTARLIRDDGAVVHINGRSAIANNMLGRGPWAYDDEAAALISGFPEIIPVTYELSPSLLVEGTNIVAVEVHQYHPAAALNDDMYFDFELRALINNGNEAPDIQLYNPPDFAQVRTPTNVVLQASVQDYGFILGYTVEFFADGSKLGQSAFAPFSLTWTNPAPGAYTLSAVVTDPGGLRATSAPVHITVAPASGSVISLIPAGSTWSYLDTGVYPGTNWTGQNYRVRWNTGAARLGYGHSDEATTVSYGPDSFNKYVTTWFRHSFTKSASLNSVILRVLRDDGIVVHLNGTEIYRNNLPGGTITPSTLASTSIVGSAESTWLTTNLNPQQAIGLMQASGNILAAEVHQATVSSPDIAFDLELIGVGNVLPEVSLLAPTNGAVFILPTNVVLTASAADAYGSVTNLEFFADAVRIASLPTPPVGSPGTELEFAL